MAVHEKFEEIDGRYVNDIAIIRVKTGANRGIRCGLNVQPICLPSTSPVVDRPGTSCSIAGSGSSVDRHGSSIQTHTIYSTV